MSDFLGPAPQTRAGLDAAVTALATNPASALATAQNATYAPVTGSPNYTSPAQAAGLSAALSIVFGG